MGFAAFFVAKNQVETTKRQMRVYNKLQTRL